MLDRKEESALNSSGRKEFCGEPASRAYMGDKIFKEGNFWRGESGLSQLPSLLSSPY